MQLAAANNFFYEKKLLNSVEILEQFLFFFYMHANHVISHYLMTIAHKALFWRKTFSSSSWSRKNIYWSRTKSTRFFAKKMTRQTFWHKALVIDLLVCQKLLALKMCISLHYNYIFSTRYVRHNHSFESLSVLVKIASTSDGSNNVRSLMFDHSKPKIGCLSSITKRWTLSSLFDVWLFESVWWII